MPCWKSFLTLTFLLCSLLHRGTRYLVLLFCSSLLNSCFSEFCCCPGFSNLCVTQSNASGLFLNQYFSLGFVHTPHVPRGFLLRCAKWFTATFLQSLTHVQFSQPCLPWRRLKWFPYSQHILSYFLFFFFWFCFVCFVFFFFSAVFTA